MIRESNHATTGFGRYHGVLNPYRGPGRSPGRCATGPKLMPKILLMLLLAVVNGGTARAQVFDLPDIPRCTQLTPGAFSASRTPARLGLRVVLDGVASATAEPAVAAIMNTYAVQGIALEVSYDFASFTSSDGGELIDELKRFYNGHRPVGTHLVYAITAKNLRDGAFGDSLAGLADCIGGVAYAENAFAVGEADPRFAALVMAHELGHLLGGHHHYANCAESLPNGGGGPCTLMINDVGLAGLPFSSLNGAVVRGHAQVFGGKAASNSTPDAGGSGGGSLDWISLLALAGLSRRRPLRRVG